jgi:uncharacterized membrane protein
MHVSKYVVVARPRHEVYAFWRAFENLPRFMHQLESVTNIDGSRMAHWVAKPAGGQAVEWDAELVEDRPNERLAWRTVGASDDIRHASAVTFLPHGSQATEVEVAVTYNAPGGIVSKAIARLFGHEPGHQIQEDLERFKRVLESREVERRRVLVDDADMPAKQKTVGSFGRDQNPDPGY